MTAKCAHRSIRASDRIPCVEIYFIVCAGADGAGLGTQKAL
jgi:hypothetical protein